MQDRLPNHECLPTVIQTHPRHGVSVRELWTHLERGELKIRAAQCSLDRCFVTVSQTEGLDRRRGTVEWRTFERVLCGDQPKVVADDLAISRSTICAYWQNTLASLCELPDERRAMPFLVVCASSTRTKEPEPALVHGYDEYGNTVVSVSLANGRLQDAQLSRAEWDIARAVVLGKDSSEICSERNTSPRTVANQLNAIYRKLGISGRRELVVAALVRT